jgi:integration host factor subunit alpha
MALTKADVVERVSEQMGFSKKDAVDHVETVFALMKNTLASGKNLKISRFGGFEVKQKNARRGRNPQTGEALTLDARKNVSYRVSTLLKNAINAGRK